MENKWYWNGWNLTSEFMIADDLPLDQVSGLDFVKHHDKLCPPREHNCDEMRSQPSIAQTGGKVLSYILGHGLHVLDKHLKPSEPSAQENPFFEQAYGGLRQALSSSTYGGALNLNESCDRGAKQLEDRKHRIACCSNSISSRESQGGNPRQRLHERE
jgi:hypothetical protein